MNDRTTYISIAGVSTGIAVELGPLVELEALKTSALCFGLYRL